MLVFPIQTNWQSKCFRFFRTFWALFVKRYTLLFHILFPPPFPVYYTDDFLKQFPARFSSSSSCCLLQNQVLLEEREVSCCCCTCTFDSLTYSIWFIWFRSAFGIQQIFLNFLEGMCYPRYFSSFFFPSPCSVFTRSGSYNVCSW